MNKLFRHFQSGFSANARGGDDAAFLGVPTRTSRISLPSIIGLSLLCLALGWLSVVTGNLASERPMFLAALPIVIAMAVMMVISPTTLVFAIILLRGGADQVFQGTQFSGFGGLGGVVNLVVILLAMVFTIRNPGRVPRLAWWAWMPLLIMQIIGIAYAPEPVSAIRFAFGQLSTFAVFIIGFHVISDQQSLRRAFYVIMISSIPVLALNLIAIMTGNTASSDEGLEAISNRYGAPFPHPNILAFYVVVVLGVTLYLWKTPPRDSSGRPARRKMPPVLYSIYIILLIGALYSTKTRSAWLAAGFLFMMYGIFAERRFLLYLAVAPAAAMLIPEFRDRVFDLLQGNSTANYARLNSFAWRQILWRSSLEWMDAAHYLAGFGSNSFIFYCTRFFPLSGGMSFNAHSVFVQLIFELGVLGLASYLWLFSACGYLMWKIRQHDRLAALIFGALLGTYLVVSAADNMLFYVVFNWYFWFTIGAAYTVICRHQPAGSGRPHGKHDWKAT